MFPGNISNPNRRAPSKKMGKVIMHFRGPCLAVAVLFAVIAHAAASTCEESAAPLGLPQSTDGEQDAVTICKPSEKPSIAFFVTHYERDKAAPRWVAYVLTRTEMLAAGKSTITRKKDGIPFASDKALAGHGFASPTDADYTGIKAAGYDRGHYLPADAMKWSISAYHSTFTVSNIALQASRFNEGIWGSLEDQERGWACDHQTIYSVTGVVFAGSKESIFHSKKHPNLAFAIPTHFWKVIYTPEGGGKAIAVLFPNSNKPGSLKNALRSVRQLEKLAGLNFMPDLPANVRDQIENADPDLGFWTIDHPGSFVCRG